MTAIPIIDRDRLEKVCMGKPEMAQIFVDALIDETAPIVAALPESIVARNYAAVREAAHAVKGMAANIGAIRLSAAAELLERESVAAPTTEVLSKGLDGLVAALAELRTEREAGS
jgi:HPt (histidine-containing phosphotransfer) domain-containing protein